MANLYILGNGFDLHHGFQTSYGNFKEYIHSNHAEYYKKIVDYEKSNFFKYPLGSNWCNVETALQLEVDLIDEDTNNQDVYESLILVFRDFFSDWITGVNKIIEQSKSAFADLDLSKNDFYFTFNYTNTLENVYGINKFMQIDNKTINPEVCRVIHIHRPIQNLTESERKRMSSQLNLFVFGNRNNAKFFKERELSPYSDFLMNFKKDVNHEFQLNKVRTIDYWVKEHSIDTIKVYGHSLDFVKEGTEDQPNLTNDGFYFYKIKNTFPEANWIFYYHNQEDILSEINAINALCLNPAKFSIRPEQELFKDSTAYLSIFKKQKEANKSVCKRR